MRSGEVKMIKTIHPQLCCVVINPIPLLINFTSFAQLQIKDKLRTFPRREGFTRNKGKISSLICWGRGQKVGPIDRGVRRSIYVFA